MGTRETIRFDQSCDKGEGMKMRFMVSVIIMLFFIAMPLQAQEEMQLTKLSEHVYAYINPIEEASPQTSFGSNCGIVVGEEGVLVIDTLVSAAHAKELIRSIQQLTDVPIKYVVNTHYHADHTWGNAEFKKLGAVIIAQKDVPITKKEIEESMAHPETFGLAAEDIVGTTAVSPDIEFDSFLSIDLGGVAVECFHQRGTHTSDSITVAVKDEAVLFLGDILFNKCHPYLGEGTIQQWIEYLSALIVEDGQIIVPGHGPVATGQDIQDMAKYLDAFDTHARALVKGKTQADAVEVAQELMTLLPDQNRDALPMIVEMNLRTKYLAETTQEEDKQ